MNADLKRDFGYCRIPEETLLYHSTENDELCKECMFFGLDFWLASVFHSTIQVWKVTKPIEVIFLCDSVDWRSWTKSSIPQLYRHIFQNGREELNDLDIKYFDPNRRNKFIAELSSRYSIHGWLAPMEENPELEICLFEKEFIQNHLKLMDVKTKGDTTYYKNSLREIEVYPTKSFYDRSYAILQQQHNGSTDRELYWEKYQRMRESLIQEFVQSEEDVLRNRERYFDLRAKLKI